MRCEEVRRSEGSLCVRASNSSRSALSFCKPCDGLGTPCAARLLATSSAHATRHRVHTTNATCIGVLQDGCCMLPCCQQGSMPVRRAGGYATCTCTCNMHMCMCMCMCMCMHVHVHVHVCVHAHMHTSDLTQKSSLSAGLAGHSEAESRPSQPGSVGSGTTACRMTRKTRHRCRVASGASLHSQRWRAA